MSKSVWGKELMFGGYAGLKHTAKQICEYIPKCKLYVEPFAGLGRTAQYVESDRFVLNDKSEYAFEFLTKNFNAEITNLDFDKCMRLYDSKDTFFLFDPPWRFTCYDSHSQAFCDRTPIEYYSKVLKFVKECKGDFIICSAVDEHEIKKILSQRAKFRGYHSKIVESEKKVIFGKKARTLIVSNKPFVKNIVHSVGKSSHD